MKFRLQGDGSKEYLTEQDFRRQTTPHQVTYEMSSPAKATESGGSSLKNGSSVAEESFHVYR
jgi:hypothetical protein